MNNWVVILILYLYINVFIAGTQFSEHMQLKNHRSRDWVMFLIWTIIILVSGIFIVWYDQVIKIIGKELKNKKL